MLTMDNQQEDQWWYCNDDKTIQGPVTIIQFLSLFHQGEVDGVTKVSKRNSLSISKWNQLSEQPNLRNILLTSAPTSPPPEQPQQNPSYHPSASSSVTNIYHSNNNNQPKINSQSDKPQPQILANRIIKRLQTKRKRIQNSTKQNTNVYVSNLPHDVTAAELDKFFSKCGLILPNQHGNPRIKIYQDEKGHCKGDALITYLLKPSVENAITLLDGALLRTNHKPICVQQATFQHKKQDSSNDNDQVETKTIASSSSSVLKRSDLIKEALNWADDDDDLQKPVVPSSQRIVVLKNVFNPKQADYNIIREDMVEGCSPFGKVEKITIFEKSAQGVVAVKFSTIRSCLQCISVMNRRWYDGRCITAELYDGKSDYRHKETDDERRERDEKWRQWLENDKHDQNETESKDDRKHFSCNDTTENTDSKKIVINTNMENPNGDDKSTAVGPGRVTKVENMNGHQDGLLEKSDKANLPNTKDGNIETN